MDGNNERRAVARLQLDEPRAMEMPDRVLQLRPGQAFVYLAELSVQRNEGSLVPPDGIQDASAESIGQARRPMRGCFLGLSGLRMRAGCSILAHVGNLELKPFCRIGQVAFVFGGGSSAKRDGRLFREQQSNDGLAAAKEAVQSVALAKLLAR